MCIHYRLVWMASLFTEERFCKATICPMHHRMLILGWATALQVVVFCCECRTSSINNKILPLLIFTPESLSHAFFKHRYTSQEQPIESISTKTHMTAWMLAVALPFYAWCSHLSLRKQSLRRLNDVGTLLEQRRGVWFDECFYFTCHHPKRVASSVCSIRSDLGLLKGHLTVD